MQVQEEKISSNTLKRNPKMELSRPDLLKLLSYLEGELQARDVAIAVFKSEKVKQLLAAGKFRPSSLSEPLSALLRDGASAAELHKVDEAHIRALADHQVATLDNLVLQNRKAQIRMARILKDAEERHKKVVHELEEEKCKHEHDTAQGDDITYGLEKERTRLKQELELERQAKRKLEKELKKALDQAEEERSKQKQIVLLLLADNKKALTKYLEERKRSEDLAQILSEEKGRVDAMAEGLEEESKKALQMEAELEKHLAQFDTERQQLRAALSREEKKVRDAELELENLRRKLLEPSSTPAAAAGSSPRPSGVASRPLSGNPPTPLAKPASLQTPANTAGAMMSSLVSKVVQPTATVSSVPVCGPTTGIARCVSPGQGLRVSTASLSGGSGQNPPEPAASQVTPPATSPATSKTPSRDSTITSTPANPSPSPATAATAMGVTTPPTAAPKKLFPGGRGAPPPVPPNKPVVPPKKPTDFDPKSKVCSPNNVLNNTTPKIYS